MLQRLSGSVPITTIGEFFRTLAGLRGFLGRTHGGEPGGITL